VLQLQDIPRILIHAGNSDFHGTWYKTMVILAVYVPESEKIDKFSANYFLIIRPSIVGRRRLRTLANDSVGRL